MGRYNGKTCRLICMLSMTFAFFLVEIVVGYITNSLALVGDSYHMLSDVLALIVGFASVRISKWDSRNNTFGWVRAEVLGALVNAVFLLSLCFTIFVEALQRLFHNEEIHDPNLLLIVGGIGLAINIVGLILFSGHGHSHGGHGHSHGGGGDKSQEQEELTSEKASLNGMSVMSRSTSDVDDEITEEIIDNVRVQKVKIASSAQLNMRGVFLHVLGDALGSVIVIISALVIKYVKGQWVFKVDPALSIVLVIIILSTTIPLLRESSLILLQTVPTHIEVKELKKKLISKVAGVLDLHEFHIWQLAGNRIIATAHIRCSNIHDYQKIAEDIKAFFHEEGIHSTTMQLEFVELLQDDSTASQCLIEKCQDSCHTMKCCKRNSTGKRLCDMVQPDTVSPGSSHTDWVGNLAQGVSTDSFGSCGECTGLGQDPKLTKLSGASQYSPYRKHTGNMDQSMNSYLGEEITNETATLLHNGDVSLNAEDVDTTPEFALSNSRQSNDTDSNCSQTSLVKRGKNSSLLIPRLDSDQRNSSVYISVSEDTPENSTENLMTNSDGKGDESVHNTETEAMDIGSELQGDGEDCNEEAMDDMGSHETNPPVLSGASARNVVEIINTNNSNINTLSCSSNCNNAAARNPMLQSRYLSVGQRPPLVRQDAIEIDETNNNA